MLVKFFPRGVGSGSGPVEYITRKDNPNTKTLREPAPEIVRGNPEITKQLIDGLDFKYKYNSGVLSFAIEDAPTEEQQQALIDSFEEYAFAGIERDNYNTLWVRHTHTLSDRVELHFVTPKVELETGKSLNIAPPGWHGYFKPWQTYWNIKEDWARPDDLSRKRIYSRGYQALIDAENKRAGLTASPDPKKQLTEYITQRIETGLIVNRDDIIKSFTELGLDVPRQGKNYITVLNRSDNQRYRLKGGIYEASWRLGGQPEKEDRSQQQTPRGDSRSRTPAIENSTGDTQSRTLEELQGRILELASARASYHHSRYEGEPPKIKTILGQTMDMDIPRSRESLSGYLRRKLGADRVLIPANDSQTNSIRPNRARDRATTTNLEPTQRPNPRDNDLRNRQRDIHHPTPLPTSEPRLGMSGTTLLQSGVDRERTRESTEEILSTASQRIQTANRNTLSSVRAGHETVRAAEQTATESSQQLERTSEEFNNTSQQLLQHHQQIHLNLERGRRDKRRKRKAELEFFKTQINLAEYAQSQGYQYIGKTSSRNSAVLRHSNGDKVIVATDTDGHGIYFSVRDDNDNGTIIDFIQNRRNSNLGGVRKELRNWLEVPTPQSSKFTPVDKPQPITKDRYLVIKAASKFQIAEEHPYLEQRGIQRFIQKSVRFAGKIAIDERGNAIFPHYDRDGLTGYSVKNTNFTGFSSGGTKTLWQSNQSEKDRSLVITESAIDAMSYHQLFGKENPHTRYIATSGTMSNYQLELIKTAMAEITKLGGEIVIATDNDEMGNKIAKTLVKVAPESSQIYRHQPQHSKDWNEVVEKERQRILSQQKQQQRSRGLEL
ncbi:conserved hypothetical protein [Hyella patelloides LEGE 07179]|uniref:Toprim domain-containing protein n=1 Tax=Hyella patelloides LEGE 07179 TaxID=945734 RepID=A0A563VRZ3_9CYAN|nr:toprim domain-containing protein [Hyella patelloides]VEP14185.1 conserved hypothetical protein [Hyella patelloides LEGE 07179]